MSEPKLNWYIVRVQGGKEKKVMEHILTEIKRSGREEYVSQVLVPTEKAIREKNGKKTTVEKILYSQYVFVEGCLTGEIQHIIRDLPFVMGFLTKDLKSKEPYPLPESEVNQLLGKVDEMASQEAEESVSYLVGESVKVIDGPFNGFKGTIDEVSDDKKKLKVAVKIFGRKTNLELNFAQVVKDKN